MSDRLSSSSVERPSSSGSPFMQLTQTNRTFHSDLPKEEHDMVVRRVQVIEHFPIKDIAFKDLSHVIGDPKVFRVVINAFVQRYKDQDIKAVVGIESRGFIFAAPVALGLKVPFVPFRKPGKLPCESVGVDIKSTGDFGKDRLETHEGAFKNKGDRVLIIDDMLGTGSTLLGACELAEKLGAVVVECSVITELNGMGGCETLGGRQVYILLKERPAKFE